MKSPMNRFFANSRSRGLPIILSTGMATLEEVRRAVTVIESAWAETGWQRHLQTPLTILHCTSVYPTDFSDANLRAMTTMALKLGLLSAIPITRREYLSRRCGGNGRSCD